MNPYPFAPLNHFTVPFSLTKKLLSPLAQNYSSAACLFARHVRPPRKNPAKFRTHTTEHPLEPTQEFFHWRRRARTKPHQQKRLPGIPSRALPATNCGGAARTKTKARYRTAAQKRQSCCIANRVRPAKHQIIAGRCQLAREKFRRKVAENKPGANMTTDQSAPHPGPPTRESRREAVSI
jgi:hypothetical protein